MVSVEHLRKKYHFEEYLINDSHFKKLYSMYLDKKLYNKILDKLVFFAIIMTLMSFVMVFISWVPTSVVVFVNSLTIFILMIFGLELVRAYAHSHTLKEFIKKHWIDVTLLVFLSFYFLFITIMSLLNVKVVEALKVYFQDAKYMRAFFQLFKR